MFLVWFGYGVGMVLVWCWYGVGMVLVWTVYAHPSKPKMAPLTSCFQFCTWRHACADSNMPWVLGGHLPLRVAMLAVEIPKQSNRSYKEPRKAGGRCSMAFGTFGSSLFGGQKRTCKKCLPARHPNSKLTLCVAFLSLPAATRSRILKKRPRFTTTCFSLQIPLQIKQKSDSQKGPPLQAP